MVFNEPPQTNQQFDIDIHTPTAIVMEASKYFKASQVRSCASCTRAATLMIRAFSREKTNKTATKSSPNTKPNVTKIT